MPIAPAVNIIIAAIIETVRRNTIALDSQTYAMNNG